MWGKDSILKKINYIQYKLVINIRFYVQINKIPEQWNWVSAIIHVSLMYLWCIFDGENFWNFDLTDFKVWNYSGLHALDCQEYSDYKSKFQILYST